MRILLVSTGISGGGAAHACLRLFDALKASGVEVRLLTMTGREVGPWHEVLSLTPSMRWRYLGARLTERLQILWHTRGHRANLWRLSTATYGLDISEHPWMKWADVVHLHWISQGFVSLKSLKRLRGLEKPIVWTLHDLWPVTGGCHLPLLLSPGEAQLCPRLRHGCGACPLFGRTKSESKTAKFAQTKAFLAHWPFRYIAVSRAERELIRLSPHFCRASVEVIPPPISLPSPQTKSEVQPQWYDPNRIYLLFASARLDDEVKGESLLHQITEIILRLAPEIAKRLTLLLVGEHKGGYRAEQYAIHTIYIGRVQEVKRMAELYRLASLTLSTSLFETFGQTLTESLICGCPVVAFASGGPIDIVRSGENGYLVPAYDVSAYAEAVLTALDEHSQGKLSEKACIASVSGFLPQAVAKQHVELYRTYLSAT